MLPKWANLQAIASIPRIMLAVALTGLAGSGMWACAPSHADLRRSDNRYDLASDLLSRGEDVAAEAELKKALAANPSNEQAHNLLGLIWVYRAHNNTALIERDDCLDGIDAEALRNEADGQMREADARFKRAVELAPDYGEAWLNRAVVSIYFRDWDGAIGLARRALENQARLSSVPLARSWLGWAHFQKKDFVRAATELLQATQSGSYFCIGNFRLASVYFEREEYQDALDRLRPMLDNPKLCPPMQEAQFLAGQASLRLDDGAGAESAFSSCVSMAPRSCLARRCEAALTGVSAHAGGARSEP